VINHANYATGDSRINALLKRLDGIEQATAEPGGVVTEKHYHESPESAAAAVKALRAAKQTGAGPGVVIRRHIIGGSRHD